MKKVLLRLFLTSFLFSFLLKTSATHIVGGDIQMQYVFANTYSFTLFLYFDEKNGAQNAKDPNVTIGIYAKSTSTRVLSITLPLSSQGEVSYANSPCQSEFLRTSLLQYTASTSLDPNSFSDAGGYFIIWERCCRNNVITNITAPGSTGTVFYTEFPALIRDGSRFINSTPKFKQPKGDYLCLGEDFSFDFSAIDSDGDLLQYEMTTPYQGNSTSTTPAPVLQEIYSVPPFPILWQPGYDTNNAIPSSTGKPLAINTLTGQLTVNSNRVGLFVFGVRCIESRNIGGIWVVIGETRRDFQFLVRICVTNVVPTVNVYFPKNPSKTFQDGIDTLVIDAEDKDFCFTLKLTDSPNQKLRNFRFRKISNNFQAPDSPFQVANVTTDATGTAFLKVCWEECTTSKNNEVFSFEIMIDDEGCPILGSDTSRIKLKVVPRRNSKPSLTVVSATPNYNPTTQVAQLAVGDSLVMEIEAFDENVDAIRLIRFPEDSIFASNLISFKTLILQKGKSRIQMVWKPDCTLISENGQRNELKIKFLTDEIASCEKEKNELPITLILEEPFSEPTKLLPSNVLTPNSDGQDDTFSVRNFPAENCFYRFQYIKIYNRWGNTIFESDKKSFVWNGGDFPAGLYFYTIDFQSYTYKGTLSLLK